MNRLFDMKIERVDTYTYKVNSTGSASEPTLSGKTVAIVFKNGKLNNVVEEIGTKHPEEWEVLGAINDEIKRLKDHYAKVKE